MDGNAHVRDMYTGIDFNLMMQQPSKWKANQTHFQPQIANEGLDPKKP